MLAQPKGDAFLCVTLPGVSGAGDAKSTPLVGLLAIEQRDWAGDGRTTPVPLGHCVAAWPERTKS